MFGCGDDSGPAPETLVLQEFEVTPGSATIEVDEKEDFSISSATFLVNGAEVVLDDLTEEALTAKVEAGELSQEQADNIVAIVETVAWSVDDTDVASISGDGIAAEAAGEGAGTATVTATVSGYDADISLNEENAVEGEEPPAEVTATASLTVEASAPTLNSIVATPDTVTLLVGTSQTITVTAIYSDGEEETVTGTLSSGDSGVASVTGSTVTAVSEGTTTVTVSFESETATVSVTVTNELEGVSISGDDTVAINDTVQLSATAEFTSGESDVSGDVTWSSSDPDVATVSATGVVTGVSTGTAAITASLNGESATVEVEVIRGPPVDISVTVLEDSLALGLDTSVIATATYADGSTEDVTGDVTWSSSDESVATVDGDGDITTVGEGTAVITAMYDGTEVGSITITVSGVGVASLSISPTSAEVPAGASATFALNAVGTDGTIWNATDDADWTSSDEDVATVTGGMAMALMAGDTTITATLGGMSVSAALTVTDTTLERVVVTAVGGSAVTNAGVPPPAHG
jgi:uncharacterized protein YjdB